MDSVEIMLKEYETLREESLAAMSNRNSILSFGVAAMGAILTASIATYQAKGHLSGLMLVLMAPILSDFTLFMWLGEYERMQRAGRFLADLEFRINDKAQERLLTWETHLRERHRHMKYPYNVTVAMLVVISIISLVIGAISSGYSVLIWVIAAAGVLVHLAIYWYAVSRISKLRLGSIEK
ncbi:MAG: hypothetical protein JXA14_15130 [Anaerolineae bacterium]|nr:hypothetical protein [Anaerolineae bacterium]